MANKKLLNSDQKKVLVKLFEQKIDTLKQEKLNEQAKVYEQASKDYLAKISKAEVITNAVAKLLKAEKDLKDANKVLDDYCLTYSDSNYRNDKRTLSLQYHNDQPDLVGLKNKQNAKIEKINELKFKLLADINCLPMTYAEINDYIEGELSKI
jgi:hypothetical protein